MERSRRRRALLLYYYQGEKCSTTYVYSFNSLILSFAPPARERKVI